MHAFRPEPSPKKPASQQRRFNKIRLPWHIFIAGLAVALYFLGMLYHTQTVKLSERRADNEALRASIELKKKEFNRLVEQIKISANDDFIINEARTKYGYLAKGEIRFVVTNREVLGLPPLSTEEKP